MPCTSGDTPDPLQFRPSLRKQGSKPPFVATNRPFEAGIPLACTALRIEAPAECRHCTPKYSGENPQGRTPARDARSILTRSIPGHSPGPEPELREAFS